VRHLLPVVSEDVRTPATRFVSDSPVSLRADDYASRASVFAPPIDPSEQRFILPEGKSARELEAEFFEELHRVDVWEFGSASRRRNTIGQTVRSAWIRALPGWA